MNDEGECIVGQGSDGIDEIGGEGLQLQGNRSENGGACAGRRQRNIPRSGPDFGHDLIAVGEIANKELGSLGAVSVAAHGHVDRGGSGRVMDNQMRPAASGRSR